jgi:hypothetical protein
MGKKMRKNGPNKSELVRQYMNEHPNEGPTAVADAVSKAHGIEVKPQFVSMIKLNLKNKSGSAKGKPGRTPKAAKMGDANVSIELLRAAKKFVAQMGGVSQAKAAVDILAELAD